MIEKKNARRTPVSVCIGPLTNAGDESDDSAFEGNNLDSSISSDADEVHSPDPFPKIEEVDTDLRPLSGITIMKPDTRPVPKKHKAKATEVLRLRDGPGHRGSWLDSDGFTRIGIPGRPILETYSEK